MRCPKCGYNSFDHNLLCPKCRKDLTATRRLLNLTVPVPGATDFFNTAGQRTAFPEPFLGNEMMPDNQFGAAFPAAGALAAGAAASAFGAPPPAPDQPFGAPPAPGQPFGAPPAPGQPFGAPPAPGQPFGAPPFSADATLDDIVPLVADEEMEDIVPIAGGGLDDIAPINDISPIEAASAIFPANPAAESTQIVVDPVLGEEEIEIEIDDLLEPSPGPAEDHQTALNQIKSTLAETGDLGAAVEVMPEPEAVTPAVMIKDLAEVNPEAGGVLPEPTLADSLMADGIGEVDLDDPLIEDIDDTDLLEADDIAAEAQPSDTVAVDLDPEDLAPDFFDEVLPETAAPEPAPALAVAPEPEAAPSLEELAQGDLAGPFWDEESPTPAAPSPAAEIDVPSLEEMDSAPALGDLSLDSLDDPGIEPEDLAVQLESNFGDLDQTLTAEEMFAEEIPPQPAAPATIEKPAPPSAMPEVPAGVFGAMTPEDTLSTPQAAPGGLDADDLSSLADDLNLDDLDSEL